jgi:hypothetical protein
MCICRGARRLSLLGDRIESLFGSLHNQLAASSMVYTPTKLRKALGLCGESGQESLVAMQRIKIGRKQKRIWGYRSKVGILTKDPRPH